MSTYAVTGATGKLGRLVLDELLDRVNGSNVVALARDPSALDTYAAQGVQVRQADYDDPASLDAAFAGVDRVLLISGNAVGQRERQHGNVIAAAKKAGVDYIAYTSILDAQESPLAMAPEHRATETMLEESGLNHDLLRCPWYTENYTGGLAPQVEAGVIYGASGEGKVSTATRADLAAGIAAALVTSKGGETYELAGDESWSMDDLAAAASSAAGKPVRYENQSQEDYAKTLEGNGLPPPVAAMLAETSALAGKGALQNDDGDLSKLSGKPTTTVAQAVKDALGS